MSALKYRQEIIAVCEKEEDQVVDESSPVNEEIEKDTNIITIDERSQETNECRFEVLYSQGGCDICSDRTVERRTTVYVCLNASCKIT